MLPNEPLSRFVLRGSPSPISRLCHRRFGFRRSFTSPALSCGGARPSLVQLSRGNRDSSSQGLGGPRAACRLLQSMTIHEHDHGPPEPRMTSLAVARRRSRSRGPDLSIRPRAADGYDLRRKRRDRGQSRFHGPGASPRSACLSLAPPIAIARGGSFAPTRSARTPHVAARDERRLEKPASWRPLPGSSLHGRAYQRSTCADLWLRRPFSRSSG